MPAVETNGARIYDEAHSEGPAVVLAYGRGGKATSWWQHAPHFAQNYKVVVFDH